MSVFLIIDLNKLSIICLNIINTLNNKITDANEEDYSNKDRSIHN